MKITDLKIAVARRRLRTFAGKPSAEGKQLKMGVILDASGNNSLQAFLQLKEDLQLDRDEVTLVICGKEAEKNDTFDTSVVVLQDLSWNGRISEETSAFLSAGYDLLISFTSSENKMADFLVSVSRARLKVGRKKSDENGIFDMNISAELSEPEVFTTELKKYLKILNATIE